MQRQPSQSPARVIAPLALAVCAVAFFYVILSSGSSDDGGTQATQRTSTSNRGTSRSRQPQKSTYTVRTGDTLGAIAAKTGVPVEKLQELNPELDPQALVSGQKI